jgi:hypothetical protein
MTTNQYLNPGVKVTVIPTEQSGLLNCKWWPKGTVTGTVTKVFKNGKVAVAVDQLRNFSEDGLRTLHFDQSDLQS